MRENPIWQHLFDDLVSVGTTAHKATGRQVAADFIA
jgi:hypothetical protein